MKRVTFFMMVVTFFMFIGISFFSSPMLANTANDTIEERDVYLNIMASNKSQYEMIQKITGTKHNVQYMFSSEEEIKNFKFTDEILSNVANMDLFFYAGSGYEPWIDEFISKVKKGKLGIINISRGMRTLTKQLGDKSIENPYYWLGLEEYTIALYNIKSAIQERDPKNRQYYEDNYNKVIKEFREKLEEYKNQLINKNAYSIVVVGDDFDYFFKGLGVEVIKVVPENIDGVALEKKLKLDKTIVIKDKNLELNSKLVFKYIANLEKFNGNKSFEEIIYGNIEEIIKAYN